MLYNIAKHIINYIIQSTLTSAPSVWLIALTKSWDIFPADNIPHLIGLLFEYANAGVLVDENRRNEVRAIVMLRNDRRRLTIAPTTH